MNVKEDSMKQIKIGQLYSQRDTRWASILLGFNTAAAYSIGAYGCLITCLGMLIEKTPDNVNTILKQNNGFQNGGNLVWSKVSALGLTPDYLSPRYDGVPVTSQGIQKAKELLDANHPLVCEIDFNPSTNPEEMHFVVLIGYNGDSFMAADPWTGKVINMDVYGGFARAGQQFRSYTLTLPDWDQTTTVAVDSKVFEDLVRKSTIADNVGTKLNKPVDNDIIMAEIDTMIGYEDQIRQKNEALKEAGDRIIDLQQQVDLASESNKKLSDVNTELSTRVEVQGQTIRNQGTKIDDLGKAIEDLKKQISVPVLTGWKLRIYKWLTS
jgi:hypothetical protein